MSSRTIKRQVLALLGGPDLDRIAAELRAYPPKEVVNCLFSAICREDPAVRWQAVTCMGAAVARLAEAEMEEARIIMRRLLWSLNDESGGIGWGAPEAMAECMCSHRGLAREYVHMLISYMRQDGEELCQDGNYIEHPLLQRGLLWGVARLAGCRPELLLEKGAGADIPPYLLSPDAEVRGLAALAAGNLRLKATAAELKRLVDDPFSFLLYSEGQLIRTTVGSLAHAALTRIRP